MKLYKLYTLLVLVSIFEISCATESKNVKPIAHKNTEGSSSTTEIKKEEKVSVIKIHKKLVSGEIELVIYPDDLDFHLDLDVEKPKPEPVVEEESVEEEGEADNSENNDTVPESEEPEEDKIEPDQEDNNEISKELATNIVTKHFLYAQKYFYEKKYNRALSEINIAVGKDPDSAVLHALKGSILYRLGDLEAAFSSWEDALKIDSTLDDVKESMEKVRNELDNQKI